MGWVPSPIAVTMLLLAAASGLTPARVALLLLLLTALLLSTQPALTLTPALTPPGSTAAELVLLWSRAEVGLECCPACRLPYSPWLIDFVVEARGSACCMTRGPCSKGAGQLVGSGR